jgi:hypothetical protein
MIRAFNTAAVDLRGGWQPSLPLELALAELIDVPTIDRQPVPKAWIKPAPELKPPTMLYQSSNPASPSKGATKKRIENPAVKPPEKNKAEKTVAEDSPQSNPSVTLAQVNKSWRQVKESLHSHPSLVALLNSSHLLEIKDGVLVLGFASDVLLKKMEVPEQLELTSKAIAEVVGTDLRVRCVISNAKQSAPSDVKADGMVAAALKKGGEIVDIQE